MQSYKGSCHCGSITFDFKSEEITSGLRCNCSMCARKGAVMTTFTLPPNSLNIHNNETISQYDFGSKVAKHYFCSKCGIYPFHQTKVKPGEYRINLGCLSDFDSTKIPYTIVDFASK